MSTGIIIFIVAILVVVMIHEAGHLLTAKLFDFKATQFFVGFGPTLWSYRKGETEYGVKALPLGGFVKIVGMNPYEEVALADQPRAYPNKPRWQRAIVLAAGSATHFVVAFIVLLIAAMTIGFPSGRLSNQVANVQLDIDGEQTPAGAAGLLPNDTIVALNGNPTESWAEVRSFIRHHPDQPVDITVERDGATTDISTSLGSAIVDTRTNEPLVYAPPGHDLRKPKDGEVRVGYLGVGPQEAMQTYGLIGAAAESGRQVGSLTVNSVKGIGQVFGQVFNGDLYRALTGTGQRAPTDGPVGIVGAGRIAGASVASGEYINIIYLIVGFTVFVGLMNLLPLPPLDGGHLAVVAYEAITKKRVDLRKLIPVAAAVISFFILLFVAVLYLDLARPINLPF